MIQNALALISVQMYRVRLTGFLVIFCPLYAKQEVEFIHHLIFAAY